MTVENISVVINWRLAHYQEGVHENRIGHRIAILKMTNGCDIRADEVIAVDRGFTADRIRKWQQRWRRRFYKQEWRRVGLMIAQAVFDQKAEDRLPQTTLENVPQLVAQAKKMPPDDVHLVVTPECVLEQWGDQREIEITKEIREKFREKLRADIMMEQLFPDSKTTSTTS